MIKKIFNGFNKYLVLSVIVHAIILIFVIKYFSQTRFVFESKERNTKIQMVNINRQELDNLKQHSGATAGKRAMHRGYKNSITSMVSINEHIDNTESTQTYEITHSKTKPMQVYNKPKSVFNKVKLNQSISSDLEQLQSDDEEEMSFVNGDRRGVVDSHHDELCAIGISINTNVKLQLTIDSEGNVISAQIVTSTGDIDKDTQIVSIVEQWKFEPGDLERQTVVVNLKYFIQ